ncbi:MAG: protein-export chaperone SecB [Pseudomonadota bacterium]
MADQNDVPATGDKKTAQFALQRIYVKDISFEAPGTPAAFAVEWKPETKVQFTTGAQRIEGNLFEVILTINVLATNGEKAAFIVEVKQAGLFLIDVPENSLEQVLGTHCPSILFPYARETISDLVSRGTFPQLLLQPMNFDAIYADATRRRQEAKVAAAQEGAVAAKH